MKDYAMSNKVRHVEIFSVSWSVVLCCVQFDNVED